MTSALLCTLLSLSFQAPLSPEDFDKKIESLLAKNKTVGCAIAFSDKGQVSFAKGYGFANLEHKVPMKPDHVHELASVSKQFTAACILQLVEKGKLSLDDKLSKFFEGAHEDWKKVTVRHLLHHMSGIPDYLGALRSYGDNVSPTQLADSIKKRPLSYEPNSKWSYSNSGYMVLGLIVAKASGKSLKEYIEENIFKPGGMKSAHYNDSLEVVPDRADGYAIRDGTVRRENFTSSSLSGTGDGEIMASPMDLLAWDRALREGKILGPAMLKQMSDVGKTAGMIENPLVKGYGAGVMIINSGNKLVQYHNGGWMGTSTTLARYVDDKQCLVILCNTEGANIRELMQVCEDQFLGKRIVTAGP